MSDHLRKLRDELAEHCTRFCPYPTPHRAIFVMGFDAATEYLMRVIEVQSNALIEISSTSLNENGCINRAMGALAEADKLLGGDK